MSFREEFVIATVLKSKGARWSLQKTLWSIEGVDRVCASDIRACKVVRDTSYRNSSS